MTDHRCGRMRRLYVTLGYRCNIRRALAPFGTDSLSDKGKMPEKYQRLSLRPHLNSVFIANARVNNPIRYDGNQQCSLLSPLERDTLFIIQLILSLNHILSPGLQVYVLPLGQSLVNALANFWHYAFLLGQ
jgi:hypothetical protein